MFTFLMIKEYSVTFSLLLSEFDFEGFMPVIMNMKEEVMRLLFKFGHNFVLLHINLWQKMSNRDFWDRKRLLENKRCVGISSSIGLTAGSKSPGLTTGKHGRWEITCTQVPTVSRTVSQESRPASVQMGWDQVAPWLTLAEKQKC